MSDQFQNFAELSAAYTEGTDFRVTYAKNSPDVAAIAIHGGGIEVGSTELLEAVKAYRPTWSWYSFEALLSSNNSVLHLTSTHFDDPRAIDTVSYVDRVISLHGASGDEPKTLIGGLDVVTKDLIRKALEKRGFVVEEATTESGIAGQEPDNIANRSKIGGVQLEMTTKQRAMFFKNEDTTKSWRTNPDNWSQYMFDYRDAIYEGVSQAQALKMIDDDRLTIIDLNDVISSTAPVNPSIGSLWLDETVTPSMLKKWDGTKWVNTGELSTDTTSKIDSINKQLGDMTSDSIVDFQERQILKDKLTEIIGYVMNDTTTTLPTVSTLDSSAKGEFFTVRKSAQMANISTSNSTYVALATAYTNLKTYLEGLTPIDVWDTSAANANLNITVTRSTLRDKFVQYYLAVQALTQLITSTLQSNLDHIEVGGANLVNGSSFKTVPLMWNGATGTLNTGNPNSLVVTKPASGNSYAFTLWGTETVKAGVPHTISFEAKTDGTYDAFDYIYLRGDNVSNTHLPNITIDKSNTTGFVKYTLTYTPSIDFVNAGLMIGFGSGTSPFEIRKVQLERGNKATDWSLSNADVTNGINDVQGSIDGLIIGARNLVRNSTFNIFNDTNNPTAWTWIDSRWIVNQPESDKPNSNILYTNGTGASAPVYASAYTNKYNARKGDVFTVSFDIKVGSLAGWDQQFPLLVEFYDSAATRVQYKTLTLADLKLTSMADNTWYRVSYTTTVTTDIVMTGAIRLILWQNGELYFREIQMEKGMKATDYKSAPEDSIDQVTVLEQRVADAEQKITDESIISVVTQSDSYLADINKKADADELGNYATSGELDEAINGVNDNIDKKINDIDFSPYVKTATLTQTVNDITAKFENGGGINQLKNSVGYASADFWTISGTQFQSIQTDELAQLGFNSGFYSPVGAGGWMSQDVYTTVGQVYTFSVYMKKPIDSSTNGYAGVDILDQNGTKLVFVGKGTGNGVTNGYQQFVYTFTAMTPIHTIRLTVGSGAEATFSGTMFNIGDVALQWSLASGELYNTNVQMNMNGLKVNQVENGIEKGFTVMTPDKFAGYYDMDNNGSIDETPGSQDEVFRMDKDEFVMKKATVKEEITMGTVKIVKISSTGTNGWAFVSNQDD
ncbi:poly-gamma-glutamate hydrolase family protein [Priestia megaterium]|uniref:poly-gamma-glutamate hydrolase family protein n=1 Tax=Priestia megaterium TaxID=1404 RepID=UPI003D2AE6F5